MKRQLITIIAAVVIAAAPLTAQSDDKLVITVLDFATEEVSEVVMETIVDRLSSSLFQTDRYIIIDTEKRDALIDEMKFTLTGLTEESSVIQVGKLLAAQAIVMGNLAKVGSKYVLSAKMLETESGKTLSTADGAYRNLEGMLDDIPKIAGLLSGTVKGRLVYEKDTPEYKKRMAGLVLIGSGAAVAGTGGFFLGNGGIMLSATAKALETYNALDAGSPAEAFDSAYDDYLTAFNRATDKNANLQMISGIVGTSVGLISAGIGAYLVISAQSDVESSQLASPSNIDISIQPLISGTRIAVRLRY